MCFGIISLLFPFTANALSATTANTIIGTAPYLTFDGTNKATGTDELLMIKLTDGQTFNKKTNPTIAGDVSTYIVLPVAVQKFEDIETLIPKGNTTVNLSALLLPPYSYGKDDDGDTGLTATGTLSVKITDANGTAVKLTDTVDACNAPYKLTLTSQSGKLETKYGIPRQTPFTGASTDYYINPKIVAPYACFAQPNLKYGTGIYAGSTNQWDPAKGFKVQDINTPSSNFPTTGSNNLFFNLTIAGAEGSSVSVKKLDGGSPDVDLTLTPSGNTVKVTLNGPSDSNIKPFKPTTFELYSDSTKIYSFTLSKWFISRFNSNNPTALVDIITYCNTLSSFGYRMPKRKDFTNKIAISSTYTRTVNGGLFSEWGILTKVSIPSIPGTGYYPDSEWIAYGVLTSELYGAAWSYYFVIPTDGEVYYNQSLTTNSLYGAVCVSP